MGLLLQEFDRSTASLFIWTIMLHASTKRSHSKLAQMNIFQIIEGRWIIFKAYLARKIKSSPSSTVQKNLKYPPSPPSHLLLDRGYWTWLTLFTSNKRNYLWQNKELLGYQGVFLAFFNVTTHQFFFLIKPSCYSSN